MAGKAGGQSIFPDVKRALKELGDACGPDGYIILIPYDADVPARAATVMPTWPSISASRPARSTQFLPATPYDASPAWDLWCLTALCPSRFLEPQNPMLTGTLDRVARNSRQGLYTMAQPGSNGELNLWTYETMDWAMCYLLHDELPQFYRLFDGYVAHASPTNVWIEGIVLPARTGSGDMPHGEAAAQYIHLVRNSLLYEDGNNLELCWGVQPGRLQSGAPVRVKDAPSKCGRVTFEPRRSGPAPVLEYNLASAPGQARAAAVHLPLPRTAEPVQSVLVNGQTRPLSPGQAVITIDERRQEKRAR